MIFSQACDNDTNITAATATLLQRPLEKVGVTTYLCSLCVHEYLFYEFFSIIPKIDKLLNLVP